MIAFWVHSKDETTLALGKPNEYCHTEIEASMLGQLKSQHTISKNPVGSATVASFGTDRELCPLVAEYLRVEQPDTCHRVYKIEPVVKSYQFFTENYESLEIEGMVPFMNPIVDGAFVPMVGKSSDLICVEERIESQKNKVEITSKMHSDMLDFVKLFSGNRAHSLVPLLVVDVYERQARPTQKHILDIADGIVNEEPKIEEFNKKEAYTGFKPPRPISITKPKDKATYSCYTYPLADYVKESNFPWYAFGHTPADIAVRVADLLLLARHATNSDFKRFDGTVNNCLREFEQLVYVTMFQQSYAEEIIELHSRQVQVAAVTKFGVKYNTGCTRTSGSPDTAIMNTLINAFVAYCTLRYQANADGVLNTPEEAWQKLGIYGGDDGLTPDINPQLYEQTATKYGLKLTADKVDRGNLGITFLARIYGPDVWQGDPNSMCDIKRQLSKLHVTTRVPLDPINKLIEKCRGYYYSDSATPIIGPFVRMVVTFSGEFDPTENEYGLRTYSSIAPACVQYPNRYEDWMDECVRLALPEFNHVKYYAWLTTIGNLSDMLEPPLCDEIIPEVREDVVMEDNLIAKPTKTPTNTLKNKKRRNRRKVKREVERFMTASESENPQ